MSAPANRREWEDALVLGAAYFTCSAPVQEQRGRGQRMRWNVVPWNTLREAITDATNCGKAARALVYAVGPAGESAPLARTDWDRYLKMRGEVT